ncbi:MAG: hypothetical protein Q8O56_14340 [Solirubrobacteraceae bacterium]|nr:hypothetical protein [Solirubrobacteraceae bacterium]
MPGARERPQPDARERERQAQRTLEVLEAEARHHRQRLALYNARMLTGKPSSPMRLEELKRVSAGADARLVHAKAERGRADQPAGSSGPRA